MRYFVTADSSLLRWIASYPKRRELLLSLVLVGMTLLAMGHTLSNDFVNYDDPVYVSQNLSVLGGVDIDSIIWAFEATVSNHWHPLTWLSLQLDVELFGADPMGFHFTNLLLHTCNAVLLFLLLAQMTSDVWKSFLVAALFAVHPLHVESVAWITERKDVLSTFFLLLTLRAYVRYVRAPSFKTYRWVIVLFVLGLLSKPMLMTLPGIMLLLDFWPLQRFSSRERRTLSIRRLFLEKIPLIIIAMLSGIASLYAQHHGGGLKSGVYLGFEDRLGYALVAGTGYLKKLVWPVDLAVFYPLRPEGIPSSEIWASAIVLPSITLGILALARSRPYLMVGWFWYLGTLLPVSGLVQLGSYAMADRYTYVPLIGIFILLVWGLSEVVSSILQSWFIGLLGGAMLIVCMALTWKQVFYWHDSIALWEHALAVTPDNFVARSNLGLALADNDRLEEAAAHLGQAARLQPNSAIAHLNLGRVEWRLGNVDEAILSYRKTLEIQPNNKQYQSLLKNALEKTNPPAPISPPNN